MNILFLSQLFCYPPDSGAKIRTYQTLRALSAHHNITLLVFIRHEKELAHLDKLTAICDQVQTCLIHRSRLRDAAGLLGESPPMLSRTMSGVAPNRSSMPKKVAGLMVPDRRALNGLSPASTSNVSS